MYSWAYGWPCCSRHKYAFFSCGCLLEKCDRVAKATTFLLLYVRIHLTLLTLLLCWVNRFVMTGSDDTNLRIWKANASEKLGKVVPREARKQEYRDSLKKR